ncbi:sensor histidine kinase [Muricomes sp. OA1]|uniref:histidine kinase n=1 Tax=Hungatella hathewayi TaxID=154046 RepID=A0A3E2WW52_9FIRM|nr:MULTISPECIES: sensor histidine kinase [Clostridia]MCH1975171.1 sensor histidine kinase [Muricomes sp. OA1]MRM89884.1 sensor histidine kinase [Faecalicatena contorta]RGC32082.1 sensor histidine kinase [Hungatella hathewayi]GKH34003.1 histidine kinase [Faecalicatena contorta]
MKKEQEFRTIFGRFKSIQSTIMVSFSVLMVIAVLIFLFIALNFTKNTIYENSINYTSQIIKQVNYDIDSYMDYMLNISSIIAANSDVSYYLYNTQQPEEELQEEKERIISQFKTIRNSRNDIYNIAVVADNGRSILNEGEDQFTEYIDVREQSWYQAALSTKNLIAISSSHVQNAIQSSYKWVITLSRPLVNYKTGENGGVFFIDLNYNAISSLCSNNNIGGSGYIFILDENGNIIYHPQQQLMYGGLKTENIDEIMSSTKDHFQSEEGDKLYTISKSDMTGWTVVGAAYTSELLKNNKQAQMMYLLVAGVLLLGVIAISSIISREITKPIRQLRDSMSMVEEGRFDKANVPVTASNEVGSLSKSFNVMTERIHTLMEQNVYEQKQKRKNELKALQAQINPHFLYNTLDSIIWMSEAGRNDEVVLMTSALARLFRQSISNDKEQVTVAEEIEYVRSYLTIQKMRYKDKLEYSIDVSPEINHVMIIKFALQPIVENAIYHGLKYKDTKGNLSIRGYVRGKKAYITIADDGVGMEEAALEHIFDETKKEHKSNGVGVPNVQKRLKLYYGQEYGISYISRKGVGTVATVTVPLEEQEDDEETHR